MNIKALAGLVSAAIAGVAFGQSASSERIRPPGSVFRDSKTLPRVT